MGLGMGRIQGSAGGLVEPAIKAGHIRVADVANASEVFQHVEFSPHVDQGTVDPGLEVPVEIADRAGCGGTAL